MRVSDEWVKDYAEGKHLVIRDLALDLQDARAEVAKLKTPAPPAPLLPCWCPYCGQPHSPAVRETKEPA